MEDNELFDSLIELYGELGDDKTLFINEVAKLQRHQKVDAMVYYDVTCFYDINSDEEQVEFDLFMSYFKNTNRNLWVVIDLTTGNYLSLSGHAFFAEKDWLAHTVDNQHEVDLLIQAHVDNKDQFENVVAYGLPLYFLDWIIKSDDWQCSIYEFIKSNGQSIECDLPYLHNLKVGQEYQMAVHAGYTTITRVC